MKKVRHKNKKKKKGSDQHDRCNELEIFFCTPSHILYAYTVQSAHSCAGS